MKTDVRDVHFQRDNSTVVFNSNVIIDLSKVPNNAKAKVYSGFEMDHQGLETRFRVDDSSFSFDIQFSSLSPKGLIRAII